MFTQSMAFPVRDPLRLLALAVIAGAVAEARHPGQWTVFIDVVWCDLGDVPSAWLAAEGIEVCD